MSSGGGWIQVSQGLAGWWRSWGRVGGGGAVAGVGVLEGAGLGVGVPVLQVASSPAVVVRTE